MNKNKTFLIFLVLVLSLLAYVVWGPNFNKRQYSCIPVVFGPADTPHIEVEIQGRKHLLEVDFGSKFQLVLNADILNNLEKEFYANLQGRDATGNSYTSPAYRIDKIQVGNLVFNDVIAKESNKNYILNTTFFTTKKDKNEVLDGKLGVIGRALLEKVNWLLDFSNFIMVECNDVKDFEQTGYSLSKMTASPFDFGRTGFIVAVNTLFGKARLSLDTGSTFTMIRPSFLKEEVSKKQDCGLSYVDTPIFQIGNRDFGRMNLYLYDITSELHEIDGLLGMDFLKTHIIYIDNKNKMIYVGDSKPSAKM